MAKGSPIYPLYHGIGEVGRGAGDIGALLLVRFGWILFPDARRRAAGGMMDSEEFSRHRGREEGRFGLDAGCQGVNPVTKCN